MLQDHYNTTFTVRRKQVTGRKTGYATAGTDVRGHIQPARSDYQLKTRGEYDKNYVLLTEFNLVIGDEVDIDGVKYSVHGVEVHNFRIGRRHTEAFIHTN